MLASNALPDWCEQLTKACPMLFSVDTRQLYFTCTAFGTSRYVVLVSMFKIFVLVPLYLYLGSI